MRFLFQEAIQNKTTMLSKIRHRATHSKDAMMASVVLTLVVVMLVVGVLHTRMWKERNFLSYQVILKSCSTIVQSVSKKLVHFGSKTTLFNTIFLGHSVLSLQLKGESNFTLFFNASY